MEAPTYPVILLHFGALVLLDLLSISASDVQCVSLPCDQLGSRGSPFPSLLVGRKGNEYEGSTDRVEACGEHDIVYIERSSYTWISSLSQCPRSSLTTVGHDALGSNLADFVPYGRDVGLI
jgi:hypothetical protein